ncbi:MAG: hypothetical protein OXD54_03080 [Candidatus Poribacteria bacterium]|nr:hypothetical protein [Candidatus Poribacteria bacterium]
MKHNNIAKLIMYFFLLFILGCQQFNNQLNNEPDGLTSVSVDDTIQDVSPYEGDVFIGDAGDRFGTDEFALNSASIDGDTLNVNLSYSGGCETHQFTLVASNSFLESFPVQLPIYISHNANGDTCEAYPTEDYQFDLTQIKTLYQEAYRQEAGTIILRLKDAPNIDLVYEFTM